MIATLEPIKGGIALKPNNGFSELETHLTNTVTNPLAFHETH